MSITPFTVILILFYIRLLLISDLKMRFMLSFVMTMICTIVIYMGYFVSFESGSTIPYSTVSWLFCTFFAYGLNRQPSEKVIEVELVRKKIIFYLLCIIITILCFYFHRYDKEVIMDSDYENYLLGYGAFSHLDSSSFKYGFVYISIMFCYVIYTMNKYLEKEDILFIGSRFVKYSLASVFVGYVEFFTENIFESLMVTNLTISFFGESGAQQAILTFDRGWSNIQGFTKEASMYSTSLFYSTVVALNMIILTGKERQYYLYLIAVFFLLLLNSSMSSYVYAFLIMIFVVFLKPFSEEDQVQTNPKLAMYLIFGAFLLLFGSQAVLLSSETYLATRLNESFLQFENFGGQEFTYSSEAVRYFGIDHCLSIFVDRPLFGVGFGCVTCVSGIVTLLTNIGIFGLAAYVLLIKPIFHINRGDMLFVLFLLVIASNLLLNDLNTMFALVIPFTVYMTIISIQSRSMEY